MSSDNSSVGRGILIVALFWGPVIFCAASLSNWHQKKLAEEAKLAKQAKPMLISGIERVFMHSSGHFSFLVNQGAGRLGRLSVAGSPKDVVIVRDLSARDSVRVEILCGSSIRPRVCGKIPPTFSYWGISPVNRLVIHLNSAKQIGGGGWNNGKYGRGMTDAIE